MSKAGDVLNDVVVAVAECLRAWPPARGPGAAERAKECIKKEVDRIFTRL